MASDLSNAFKAIADAIEGNKKTLEPVAQLAISIITFRTRKGLDADGQRFKPYTKKYIPYRRKKKLQTQNVDLTVTGHMLGSMQGKVTGPGEITVEFNGTKEIAKAAGNSNKRDFFDIRMAKELDALAEALADEIEAGILK